MNSQKRSSRKMGNRRARGRRGNGVQRQGPSITRVPRTLPLCPPMPEQMNVSLRNAFTKTANASLFPVAVRFGLFEFLGDTPQYLPQFYTMYKFAKLIAVTVRTEVINTGTAPLLIAQATMPYSDSSTTMDPRQIQERPRSVSTVVGASTGASKGVISKNYFALSEMGQPVYDRLFWITQLQSLSTSPVDNDEPIILSGVGNVDPAATSVTFVANYLVTYHIQFFDLENVTSV